MDNLLTIITFLPLVGVALLFIIPRSKELTLKYCTFIFMLADFIVSLPLWWKFELANAGPQFVEKYQWIPGHGIEYYMAVDGISLLLVLLTTFLGPITVLCSWTAITKRVKEYMICLLLLQTGMIGVFVSLNLFLFYIFWEAMLIPMYFLIGVWGGERRIYAAIKFFLYTLVGSLLMLVAILYLYFAHRSQTGVYSFDLFALYNVVLSPQAQDLLFLAFALAFAIKVPMFPFHTWLPDAHVEAPTAGSVVLAGVLLKMGSYGFLRFALPLFPLAFAKFLPLLAILAVIGVIYGALVSMVQTDLKKLVAFSSVSHLGLVMLGAFALNIQGLEGSILQMINHGLSTGALFLIVGVIYERRHTRLIADFGGLSKIMPVFAAVFMIVTLSSIGLPGLNGFVGELLIILGAFKAFKVFAILSATGLILGAVYMLWMFQRVMYGEVVKEENKALKDMNAREILTFLPILALIVWIGVYPQPFLRKMDASVQALITRMTTVTQPVAVPAQPPPQQGIGVPK